MYLYIEKQQPEKIILKSILNVSQKEDLEQKKFKNPICWPKSTIFEGLIEGLLTVTSCNLEKKKCYQENIFEINQKFAFYHNFKA